MTAIFRFCRLLLVVLCMGGVLFSAAPTWAATSVDFELFPADQNADTLGITGVSAIDGGSAFTIQDSLGSFAPVSGNAVFNLQSGGAVPNPGATLTIDFSQPQSSYSFDLATGHTTAPGYTIDLYMVGATDKVDSVTGAVAASGSMGTPVSYGGTALFNRMVVSSTADIWGIDNLTTVDASANIIYIPTGGSTALTEGGATDSYAIVLAAPPTADVTITIAPNAECIVAPTSLTFTPVNYDTPQVVVADDVDDLVADGTKNCVVAHTAASTDINYDTLSTSPSFAVADNDSAGVTVNPTTRTIAEGANNTYTLVLTSQPTANVTITPSTDAAQCSLLPTSVVFTDTDWNTPQTITVTAVDDSIAETSQSCTVTHSASGSDTTYNALSINDVVVTIDPDNDTAAFNQSTTALGNIAENSSGTYTIKLDTQPTGNVVVDLSSTDTTICTVSPTSVTFSTVNWASAQTITVSGVDNLIVDAAGRSCTIQHTVNAVTTADAIYKALTLSDVSATITNVDVAGVTLSKSTVNITEGGATDSYTIQPDTLPVADLTISITPDLQCNPNTTSITFTAGDRTAQTITVTAVDDALVEGAHSCTIAHAVTASGADYSAVTIGDVLANVTDNDGPGYSSLPAAGTTLSPASITVPATPINTSSTATVTISESGNADLNITSYSITGGPELSVSGTAAPFGIVDGGASVDLTITCNAAASGTYTGQLTVNHNAVGSPAVYDVSCTVTAPGYSSSPAAGTPITVPSTPINAPSTSNVTISETGNAQLDITSYSITGGPELSVSGTASPFSIVDGGASVDLTITCNAATDGTYTGTLTVSHNAGADATYAVSCTVATPGYGSSPAAGTPITVPATTINTASTSTVTISETGNAALSITSYSITGGPELSVSSLAGANFSIADGGTSVDLTITCNAAADGVYTGTLTVNHNAGAAATYAVSCTVASPVYSSSPAAGTPITVPATTGGTPSTSTVTISEAGNAALNITSYSITGGPELSVSSLAGASFSIVDGGASVDLTITCSAAVGGTYTGTLTVNHNAGAAATYAVSCTVTAPGYSSSPAAGTAVSPTPITVPGTAGGTPSTVNLVISETGNAQLDITSYSIAGDPELSVTNTPFSIQDGGASVDLPITCNGTLNKTYTGTLTVNHNAAGSPAVYTVSCAVAAAGYGSSPTVGNTITINTTTAATGSANLTVSETGSSPLTITGYNVTGGPALSVATSTFTIADGGASVNIPVQCSSASVGTFSGTLTVNHNASGSPATYPVVCNVTAAPTTPTYTSNPAPGSTLVISTTLGSGASGSIRVTNTGTGTLSITNVVLGASAQLSLVSSPTVNVASGQFTDITVQCAAGAVGSFSASLVVTHSATGTPANYTVRCDVVATAAAYGSTPAPSSTLDIGMVLIGTAISNNLTIFETGGAALNINSATISGSTEFAITAGMPPFTIADGGVARSITITCIPTSAGLRTALLTITTNVPTQSTVTYGLSCTGSTTVVVTATPVGFVASPTPPPAPTATVIVPATGTVQGAKGLAIRTGPYLGASLIGVLRPGTEYSILAMNNDEGTYTWYLVEVNGRQGWVSGRFLDVKGTTSAIASAGSVFDQIDGAADIGVRVVTDAIVDLRRRPSPRMPSIAVIPANAELIVIGRSVQEKQTFWLQVIYNGTVGWIPSLPVALRGPVDNLPVR